MNSSESGTRKNDGRASKPPIFTGYKGGIFWVAIVTLSLIITFFLPNRFQARQDSAKGTEALSTTVIRAAPSAALTSPVSPISPVSPVTVQPPSQALDPRTLQSMVERGLELYEGDDYAAALEVFDTVVDADPKNPLAHDMRGTLYTALHSYDDAVNEYTEAIELNPSFAQAYYNRGRVY
ncbi:MAG: tetratricopeptide repeat protein, partial [Anaerolineales bacterium]